MREEHKLKAERKIFTAEHAKTAEIRKKINSRVTLCVFGGLCGDKNAESLELLEVGGRGLRKLVDTPMLDGRKIIVYCSHTMFGRES